MKIIVSLKEKEIEVAKRIDDLIIGIIEIFWMHVSVSSETVGFNMKEHYIIEILGKRESATMTELSSIFQAPPTTMTSIIDRLVKKDYVKRRHSDEDRRIVLVSLSAKGRVYYRNHRQESIRGWVDLLSGLPDKGEKLIEALEMLKNISIK